MPNGTYAVKLGLIDSEYGPCYYCGTLNGEPFETSPLSKGQLEEQLTSLQAELRGAQVALVEYEHWAVVVDYCLLFIILLFYYFLLLLLLHYF